jgi:membrane-associated phospholipid phosphatase
MSSLNLLPSDWITVLYLAVSSVLMLIFHRNLARWYIFLSIHIAAVLGILSLHFVPGPLSPLLQFVRDWYVLATILLFYWGVKPLTQMVFQGMFDDRIVRWENRLFKGQPSTYLSARFPSVALSEYLHLCYLSYYFIPVFLPTMLYFRGKGEAFFETLFAELFTFNLCLIWYIFFPVAGPRYSSEKIDESLSSRPLCRLTHAILSRASTKGAAFPSSHSALAIVVLLCGARYDLVSFVILFPFCTGLVVGTVYGRFHYALDAVAGVLLGVLTFGLYPIVYRWF